MHGPVLGPLSGRMLRTLRDACTARLRDGDRRRRAARTAAHATRPNHNTDTPAPATNKTIATSASSPVNSVSRLLTCIRDPSC